MTKVHGRNRTTRATKNERQAKLPGKFEELVGLMPPRAISDEVQHENTVEVIDRLMASGKLTRGQEIYLETLVQLVQAYEASYSGVSGATGIEALRHLMQEQGMNASGLAALLGVHVSMGSKILRGERSLTVDHIKVLAAKFRVRADTFVG